MASLTKGAILLETITENELPKTPLNAVFLNDKTISIKKPDGTFLSFDNTSAISEKFTKKEQLVEALTETNKSLMAELGKEVKQLSAVDAENKTEIDKKANIESPTVNNSFSIKTDALTFSFKIDNSVFNLYAANKSIFSYDTSSNVLNYNVDSVNLGKAIHQRIKGETAGMVTLSQGIATVVSKRINKNSKVCLHRQLMVGSPGQLFIQSIKDGESFIIKSTMSGDSSTIYWYLEELGD
jgi:hypothetical protein